MSGLDVAGVIGTWVAVGIALIALVGIVGPLLVWRASRTERHRALAAIGLKNNGYVSRGIAVWPGVRFQQRVRAPQPRQPHQFNESEWLSFHPSRVKELPESSSTWVQFGACLQSYGVLFDQGNVLCISDGKSSLPVHKSFLKVFCIVGRYSDVRRERNAPRADQRLARTNTHWMVGSTRRRRRRNDYDLYSRQITELHGITGTLRFVPPDFVNDPCGCLFKSVHYLDNLQVCQRGIAPESVSLATLLMLFEGFLRRPNGDCLSMFDPHVDDESTDSEEREFAVRTNVRRCHDTGGELIGRGCAWNSLK